MYILITFRYVLRNPYRTFAIICLEILRSYTFCATLPQIQKKMCSKHTFLYVLCNPPTNSKKVVLKSYVPIRSEQPSRSSCLISYVPTSSGYVPTSSAYEIEKCVLKSYVPTRSVQQYRKSFSEKKTKHTGSTVSQKNAGGLNAHTLSYPDRFC